MAKILAIDDEPQIVTALSRGLQRVGHEVIVARNGADGLTAAAAAVPDAVVLDLLLPDVDGIEVVRRLRTWTPVPVLLLSGQGSERARVAALDAGADDFVDKPFSMEELRARLDAALRRSPTMAPTDASLLARAVTVVERSGVVIDLAGRRLTVAGEPVRLTPTEWKLLATLMVAPDRLLTYRQVITAVWDERHGDEARVSLRAHLRGLRSKLGDPATAPRFIATEAGVGYRWIGGSA